MRYSTLNEEKKLWRRGYKIVAGLDEAGRGPLAGPVVACAVCVCARLSLAQLAQLRDSKQCSAKQRKEFYKVLTAHPNIQWGIGIVSEKVIDQINIFQATKLAMLKSLANLRKKLPQIDFAILDGNFTIDIQIPQKAIVKGDEKVFSCAAASIIAKVTRDRLMIKLHKKYPQYGFDTHKGYGTKLHFEMLKKHGPCPLHRKSFRPILQRA